jgi:hypothetical protein
MDIVITQKAAKLCGLSTDCHHIVKLATPDRTAQIQIILIGQAPSGGPHSATNYRTCDRVTAQHGRAKGSRARTDATTAQGTIRLGFTAGGKRKRCCRSKQ